MNDQQPTTCIQCERPLSCDANGVGCSNCNFGFRSWEQYWEYAAPLTDERQEMLQEAYGLT